MSSGWLRAKQMLAVASQIWGGPSQTNLRWAVCTFSSEIRWVEKNWVVSPLFTTAGFKGPEAAAHSGISRFVANWVGIDQPTEACMAGGGGGRGSRITWASLSRKIKTKNQCTVEKFCYVCKQLPDLNQGSSPTENSWLCHGTAILPILCFSSSCFSILGTLSKVSWHSPPSPKKGKQTLPHSFLELNMLQVVLIPSVLSFRN